MRVHTAPLSALITLATLVLPSSQSGSSNAPPFEVRDLEKRNDQYIINPCPEFLGLPKQKCGEQPCGRDTKTRGICDNIRLNGLQDQRCRFSKDCGDYCLCTPVRDPGYAQALPANPVQFIGIMCPEQYGLPKQKCSDPRCGGDSYYPGYCDNKLASGAQPPGCNKLECSNGVYCDCDNSNSPVSSGSWDLITANTTWISGTATLFSTSGTTASVLTTQRTLTPSSPSTAGLSGVPTSSTSAPIPASSSQVSSSFLRLSSTFSQAPIASLQPSVTSLSQSSLGSPDVSLITQTGPIWEPTVAPGPVTSGGMIIPIIPIIPLVPPPAGFVPPPPGTPEPSEQCPADYQETKCGECGGEYGWCQQPPNQGCPCQEACTTGDNMPDCNDSQCEGEEKKCTIGPQKDCECKPECPVGIDGPRCDDTDCEGVSQGQCTTGQYAGCDCIGSGTIIYESEDYSWAVLQQGILNLLAVNAPNGAYSSLLGTATASLMPNGSTATASTMVSATTKSLKSSTLSSMGSMITRPSNSSALTAHPATTTTSSRTCYTVRSYTICVVPKATDIDGHTTTEIVTTTLNMTASQAATTLSRPCWTVRSHTICLVPEATVLNGHMTTEMMTTTLGVTSPQSSTSTPVSSTPSLVSSTPSPISSTPAPVVTPPPPTPPTPTGPMYGIYIALETISVEINGVEGFGPTWATIYKDLIWVSAAPATSSDNLFTGPQYCSTKGVDSTIEVTRLPTVDPLHPFPTASITSLRPSGSAGPSCDWIPSPDNDQPGVLNCDANPTSVDCVMPLQAATTCGTFEVEVRPLVQCVWQGE